MVHVVADDTAPRLRPIMTSGETPATNVYVVGDGGILQYDGTRWSGEQFHSGTRVWGAGADVFVLRTMDGVLYGTH